MFLKMDPVLLAQVPALIVHIQHTLKNKASILHLGKIPRIVLNSDKYLLKIHLASCQKAVTRKWLQVKSPT